MLNYPLFINTNLMINVTSFMTSRETEKKNDEIRILKKIILTVVVTLTTSVNKYIYV